MARANIRAGELETLLAELVEELPAAEVELVRLDIVGAGLLDGPLFLLGEHHPKRLHDVLRDLVLHREDVLQVPVVTLGPEMISVGHVDQLRGDPEPVAGLANAALQHRRAR